MHLWILFLFLCRYCSTVHPSWAELAQFVRFLYVQLNDYQVFISHKQESFCSGTDFNTFVMKCMIRMSQVCYYINYMFVCIYSYLIYIFLIFYLQVHAIQMYISVIKEILCKAYADSCMHGYGCVSTSKVIHTALGLFLYTVSSNYPYVM